MSTRLGLVPQSSQRGQALFETALFMPLMLIAMLSVLYFGQYGVLQERAVEAVRNASLMVNESAAEGTPNGSEITSPFSFETLYLALGGLATFGPTDSYEPLGNYACTTAVTQVVSALYQSATMPSGTTTASPGFFHSDTTPTGSCFASSLVDVPLSGTVVQPTMVVYVAGVWPPASASDIATVDIAKNAIMTQYTEVDATKNTPEFLQKISPGWTSTAIKGGMTYSLGYGVDALLALYPCFAWMSANGITQLEPTPQPYQNYNSSTGPLIASTVIDQLSANVVIVLGSGPGAGALSPPPTSGVANCPCAQ